MEPTKSWLIRGFIYFAKIQLTLHIASQNKERFHTNHDLSPGYVLYSLNFLILLYKLDAAWPNTI